MASSGSLTLQRAPWWGGFYERLVGSVKRCLRKALGSVRLKVEELSTVLTEVEEVSTVLTELEGTLNK